MKFKVRDGFVCLVDVPQLDGDGKIVGLNTNTFTGGSTVDFDEVEAEKHKHKLEALDKAAARFLAPTVVDVVDIPPAQVIADHAEQVASLPK